MSHFADKTKTHQKRHDETKDNNRGKLHLPILAPTSLLMKALAGISSTVWIEKYSRTSSSMDTLLNSNPLKIHVVFFAPYSYHWCF